MSSSFICKECGQAFKSERSLHAHLKKHSLTVAEYYTTHFPRYNLLTGKLMPFKNKEEYFRKDFSNKAQMLEWLSAQSLNSDQFKDYLLTKIYNRINEKKCELMPSHIELELCDLPPLKYYKKAFGSYSQSLNKLKEKFENKDLKLTYGAPIVKDFFEKNKVFDELEVLIDTREQKPLTFKVSKILKLDFGDYTVGGDDYSYTYVDRKSESDFKSTMSVGFDRFVREIERARNFDSFLYIVVDSSIENIRKNNRSSAHRSNLSYIWHNVRKLIREYSDNCQFIFSGNRKASEFLIPRLLSFGKLLWDCDMQYFVDERVNSKL